MGIKKTHSNETSTSRFSLFPLIIFIASISLFIFFPPTSTKKPKKIATPDVKKKAFQKKPQKPPAGRRKVFQKNPSEDLRTVFPGTGKTAASIQALSARMNGLLKRIFLHKMHQSMAQKLIRQLKDPIITSWLSEALAAYSNAGYLIPAKNRSWLLNSQKGSKGHVYILLKKDAHIIQKKFLPSFQNSQSFYMDISSKKMKIHAVTVYHAPGDSIFRIALDYLSACHMANMLTKNLSNEDEKDWDYTLMRQRIMKDFGGTAYEKLIKKQMRISTYGKSSSLYHALQPIFGKSRKDNEPLWKDFCLAAIFNIIDDVYKSETNQKKDEIKKDYLSIWNTRNKEAWKIAIETLAYVKKRFEKKKKRASSKNTREL